MVETKASPQPHDDHPDSRAHEVASMYGLTPKVEAAIREAIESEQWRRLRLVMDPLPPPSASPVGSLRV